MNETEFALFMELVAEMKTIRKGIEQLVWYKEHSTR